LMSCPYFEGSPVHHYEHVLEHGRVVKFDDSRKHMQYVVLEDVGSAKLLTNSSYPGFMTDYPDDGYRYPFYDFASFVNLDKNVLEITFYEHAREHIFGRRDAQRTEFARHEMRF